MSPRLTECVGIWRVVVMLLLASTLLPVRANGQARVPVFGDGPIPTGSFKTWSLFLPCNPEWLLDKKADALRKVFNAYRTFGRTSGDRHAAVWFVMPAAGKQANVEDNPENLDIERAANYCQRFGLVSSEGPHIVVTTTHPDRWVGTSATSTGDPIVILALGRSSPDDIVKLLVRLNDQVSRQNLSQQALSSQQYWRSWLRVFEAGCHTLDDAKFAVKAGVFSIEKTGICK